jgi:hypothetical protein
MLCCVSSDLNALILMSLLLGIVVVECCPSPKLFGWDKKKKSLRLLLLVFGFLVVCPSITQIVPLILIPTLETPLLNDDPG